MEVDDIDKRLKFLHVFEFWRADLYQLKMVFKMVYIIKNFRRDEAIEEEEEQIIRGVERGGDHL